MTIRVASAAGLVALASLGLPGRALAQRTGDGFLFREPYGAFAIRMGYSRPNATGDVYSMLTDQLTLTKGSFGALALSADLSFRLTSRLDILFSAGWNGSNAPSEMRKWLDPANNPIPQTTTLQRVPLTASLKWYLTAPGRSVGRFAWVPSRVAPYVGVGGGAMYYRLHEWGNFVDLGDSTIFTDEYSSSDWTTTAHVFTGVEMALGPRFVLSAEARYTWARAALGSDYTGFPNIDLSGFALTAGVGVRF